MTVATRPTFWLAPNATARGSRDTRRRALIRKELAWLRRGPPARTTKPKFRMDAAFDLIQDEPEPRNSVELLRFATARIGNRVLDVVGVSKRFKDGPPLLDNITWRLGPADRIALVGVNGSGKTTLMKLLTGEELPDKGSVKRGQTVRLAQLSQDTVEIPEHMNVIQSLEEARLLRSFPTARKSAHHSFVIASDFEARARRLWSRIFPAASVADCS